jgi:hypothetical protein
MPCIPFCSASCRLTFNGNRADPILCTAIHAAAEALYHHVILQVEQYLTASEIRDPKLQSQMPSPTACYSNGNEQGTRAHQAFTACKAYVSNARRRLSLGMVQHKPCHSG